MKTLIKNGLVYDGLGNPPRRHDLLVEGDRIADVAPTLQVEGAAIVDAAGMAVTPGFVDTHRHCDLAALRDADFGALELAQGITTAICGNCGLAPVPSTDEVRGQLMSYIEPCLGQPPEHFSVASFESYLTALESAGTPINLGVFTAAGAVKAAVRGYRGGEMSAAERERAAALIGEALGAGAFGLSMGILYSPECYSNREELVAMASAAKGSLLVTHIRGEGDSLVESVEEVIQVAERGEVSLHISHFKSTGVKNWRDKIFRAIDKIERARSRGQDVTVDFYPYTAGSTTLMSLLPPEILAEGQTKALEKLAAKEERDALKAAFQAGRPGWDNLAAEIGWERIVVSGISLAEHRGYSGRSVADLAHSAGADPVDFVCDLLVKEQGKVSIILMSMAQEDVDTVVALPYSMLISDALYGVSSSPHPRLYGAFPEFIQKYALERGLLPLEQALCKMTSMPAKRIGLTDRGIIAPSAYADLAIFDPGEIAGPADYSAPKQLAAGISHVFANGKTAEKRGLVLRRQARSK